MSAVERVEDALSPGAAESLTGIVVLARRVEREAIAATVASARVLCIAAAAYTP